MKTIKVKALQEAISVNDPEVKRRVRKILRAAAAARDAAKKAREQGKEALATRLEKRADELDELAANINIDNLEDDPNNFGHGGKRQAGQGKGGKSDHEMDGDNSDEDDEDDDGDSEQPDDPNGPEEPNDPEKPDDPTEPKKGKGKDKPDDPNGPKEPPIEPGEPPIEPGEPPIEPGEPPIEPEEPVDPEDPEGPEEPPIEPGEPPIEPGEPPIGPDGPIKKGKGKGKDKGIKGDPGDPGDPEDEDDDSDDESDGQSGKGKGGKKSKSKKGGNQGDDDDDSDDDQDDDDDNDDESESDDPVKDPFADEEDIPQLHMGKGKQEPRDATIEDIIKQIKSLKGEARKGAIQALKDLIASKKPKDESLKLTEAKKSAREMSDDEFGDLINSTWEMIKEVETDVEEIDSTEIEKRKEKVKEWEDDPNAIAELNAEDTMDKKKERHKIKAKEKEAQRYRNFKSIEAFKISFEGAIKNQIEMVLADYMTWDEINPEYELEDILVKADVQRAQLDEALPIIDVYFDQSGSWYPEDKEVGRSAIATIQKEYADKGLCVLHIYYFDDDVTEDENDPMLGRGGTNAWPDILDNIVATKAKNVVIMTDSDMDWDAKRFAQTCRVDGCVWWIWKNGKNAQECVKHLIGRAGNYQFSFQSSR